ncbi:MAG TPA: hypothetical protein VNQ76_07850 [Planctomicrobium sp.]|nr:hypothetical protein [Planctomicrobium sp.]
MTETNTLNASLRPVIGWASLLMILASMTIVTARLWDAPTLRSANDRSRWCTVWSLVERNTYQIDEIRQRPGWDTIDIVRHEDHFYSSKPPLLPRLVAELYRGVKALTGWSLDSHPELVMRLILFLINIMPMGLALWMFSGLLREECPNPFGYLLLMAIACFGTMLLPFLTVFNNHNVAATSFFIALPLAVRALSPERRRNWHFVACGLVTAFGTCNELPSGLLGLGVFLILLRAAPKQTLTLFVPAALIPLIAFFVANFAATGSWKPFYASYGTETYEFVHEGVPSYWSDPKGVDRPRDSTLGYLFHCTLGHHGILSLSPIFLLTIWGWLLPSTYRNPRLRAFQGLGVLLTLATLAFYLSRTDNYNYGGVSVALRWILWLTPFWILAMVSVVQNWGNLLKFRWLAFPLLAVSIFSAWTPSNAPWTQNWIYRLMEQAKWIDYSDPRPEFQQTHYTWLGLLPTGELQEDYWIRFQSTDTLGTVEQLELRDAGPGEQEHQRRVKVIRSVGDVISSEVTYLLEGSLFATGRPVEEFLLSREDGQELTEQDRSFFRGMPRRVQYILSRIRYEKTSLRTDAFRSHICYTNVSEKLEDGTPIRISRDVWLTEELPFGVVKWEERVLDRSSGEVLVRRIWLPAASGKFLERPEPSRF